MPGARADHILFVAFVALNASVHAVVCPRTVQEQSLVSVLFEHFVTTEGV